MRLTIQRKDNTVDLAGELTIYSVAELCAEYRTSPFSGCALSGIKRIDSAGFQTLLYIKREGERIGKPVEFQQPSDEVRTICSLFNEPLD